MQDSFDILEEKVKKAAELVKKLRRDNKSLDDQLKDSKAKLAEAEKKLAALEAQMGDAAGNAAKIDGLTASSRPCEANRSRSAPGWRRS